MDVIRQLEKESVKVFKSVEETGRELGKGSFGTVVELTIKGRAGKFAGKKIHEVLVTNNDATLLAKECKVMSALEHPNIVRFCGVCRLSSSNIPVLVMELMHQNLEDAIESKAAHLGYDTTLSILVDVANGLAYLHCYTPRVFHRDLTARNVLLDHRMKAKITDFGNSKIIHPSKVGATMTQAPGTIVYMPPEAFGAKSKYSDRLDIFSFGHLALYAMILQFPMGLLPPTYSNAEGSLVARSEVERRQEYMDMLSVMLPTPDHYMYQLIEQCLHNEPTKRPSAVELLFWLQEISRVEHKDFEDSMTEGCDDIKVERVTKSLQGMQAYINKRPAEVEECEKRPQAKFKNKMGLIDKRSVRMLRGGWKPYQFTVDYNTCTFHYTRLHPFGPSTVLQLGDITEVKELDVEESTYPFEVYFKGSNLPWILRTYSKAERKEWKEALECFPSKISIGEISSPRMTAEKLQAEVEEQSQSLGANEKQEDTDNSFQTKLESAASSHTENDCMLAKQLDEAEASEEDTSEYDSRNIYVELPETTTPTVKVIPPSPKPQKTGNEPPLPKPRQMGNESTRESPIKVGFLSEKREFLAESLTPPHHKKSPTPVGRHLGQILKSSLNEPQEDDADSHLYEPVDWTKPAEGKEAAFLPRPRGMKSSTPFPQRETHGEENIYESPFLGPDTQPSGLSFHPASDRRATGYQHDNEAEEDVYVYIPEVSPAFPQPPAVTIEPPSPRPRRRTEPTDELKHLSVKTRVPPEERQLRQVQDEPQPEEYQPNQPKGRRGSPANQRKTTPRAHPRLTQARSVPIDYKRDDSDQHVYEPVNTMQIQIPPNEAPSATITLPDTPPHPPKKALYLNLPPARKSSEFSKVAPPVSPKPRLPRPPSPVMSQHQTLSPTKEYAPSPKPRQRNQPPSPVLQSPTEKSLPVMSTELQNLLHSIPGTGDRVYEVVDPELVAEPLPAPLQRQPPIPPQRKKKFTFMTESQTTCSIVEQHHGEETCADLEDLQKKALSIPLSSISDIKKIGEGQFGEVYGAKIGKTTVALKIVRRFSSQMVMDQFEDEMSIMSQVYHHNIVRVHGILREGPNSPALVMEFLPHGDLKNFLTRKKQPIEFLIKCMTDVAMGMHYLCERGLIHRDLAARNILLDENKTCKVSDFGLLREVPKDKSIYIAQGDSLSPIRWMAPESISDNTFTPATDVWSYGILQWEMFFPDRNPYHDMDNTQVVAKVVTGYRMPLPEECPELVGKIMKACWQHDPRSRPNFKLITSLLIHRDRVAM